MSDKEYIYVHEASKQQLLAELMKRTEKSRKFYIVFNNWVNNSQMLLFKHRMDAIGAFEKIVREQIDPDSSEESINEKVLKALKKEYFEYGGDGTESFQPFVEIQELELN